MAKFPTIEEMARDVAEKALDEYEYNGKTLREWIEIISASEHGTNLAEVGTDAISRQALLDKFEPWLKVKDYNDGELNMLKAILYEIRFMRSAEPKRGWWIEIINSRGVVVALRCSRCEKSPRHGARSDFCPNCGADMRGEQDG